jgi:ABC-type polysaccharide/polyol phosphate transport system ATPase subunit
MVATKQAPTRVPVKAKGTQSISVENASVRYRLLTEDDRTLKGRLLSAFGTPGEAASFWALRNVSLKIGAGEVVGIVGRNGSGKSTLLKAMSRVIEPTEGRIDISGKVHPILELGSAMSPDLTGRENVYLNGALMRIERAQLDELIPQIVSFAELGPFFDLPTKTYSSGMSARLAFAMSTMITPEILILDEVLAVGDEYFQRKSVARMKSLMDKGSIVVIVSHASAFIESVCTRAIYLAQGQVVADGKPRDVIARYRADDNGF